MLKRKFYLIVFSLTMGLGLTTGSIQAKTLTHVEMASDLAQMVSLIKSGYGPLQYKERTLNIDVDKLANKYSETIKTIDNNSDFYYMILRFVSEFKDSHFRASVPTDHMAFLGFNTDLVEGKVLIDEINRNKLPEKDFPFQKGDEIVSIDSTPITEWIQKAKTYVGMGFDKTAERFAAMALAVRSGKILPTPSGQARLEIRRGTSSIVEPAVVKWLEQGTPIDEVSAPAALWAGRTSANLKRDYFDLSIRDVWADFFGSTNIERKYRCSGETRIAIPKDATMVMDKPFVAYYHPTEHGNIGYLRIPHYYPQNAITGEIESAKWFSNYEYAVSVLEKNTVGLVIDQDHNCGGSVELLERMVGLFMDKPYAPQQFTLLANKQEYLDMMGWLKSSDPYTLEYQGLLKVAGLIKDSWFKGDFMTPKTSITGVEIYHPHYISYTKPIVMLIDELSGSGGDAFPSLMQGYGRAKLIGTRTMGAGGHVVEQPPLFFSQIKINMTKSLFYRPDGVEVENNGAVPDFDYNVTRDDFLYGYKNYQAFYLEKLREMIRGR